MGTLGAVWPGEGAWLWSWRLVSVQYRQPLDREGLRSGEHRVGAQQIIAVLDDVTQTWPDLRYFNNMARKKLNRTLGGTPCSVNRT